MLNQTYSNWEMILVDDGSPDACGQICDSYAEKDGRIHVIHQENQGLSAARNAGIKICKGEWIYFLDSDDFFEFDMLEKAYEKAKGSNAQIVVFRSDQYREDLKEFVKVKWTLHEKQLPPYRPMNFRSFTGNVFRVFVGWAWDKLFERKFVEENHLKFQELRTSNDMLFVFSAICTNNQSIIGSFTSNTAPSR